MFQNLYERRQVILQEENDRLRDELEQLKGEAERMQQTLVVRILLELEQNCCRVCRLLKSSLPVVQCPTLHYFATVLFVLH